MNIAKEVAMMRTGAGVLAPLLYCIAILAESYILCNNNPHLSPVLFQILTLLLIIITIICSLEDPSLAGAGTSALFPTLIRVNSPVCQTAQFRHWSRAKRRREEKKRGGG